MPTHTPTMDKRTFLKILAAGTAGAGSLPWLMQSAQGSCPRRICFHLYYDLYRASN